MHVPELAGLVVEVVLGVVGPKLLAIGEVQQVHVAAGLDVSGVLVVVDVVGFEQEADGLDLGAAAEVVERPLFHLLDALNEHFPLGQLDGRLDFEDPGLRGRRWGRRWAKHERRAWCLGGSRDREQRRGEKKCRSGCERVVTKSFNYVTYSMRGCARRDCVPKGQS